MQTQSPQTSLMHAQEPAPARPTRGRPRKHVPGHGETREALINVGVAMLTEKGYAGTGIEDILKALNIPKGSFYHYFPSKDAFTEVLIASYADYFAQKLERCFRDEAHTPLNRLRAFIEDARAGMQRFHFRRGCLVGNLGQEMSALPELFRARLLGALQDWQRRTARCLREAQQTGELPASADCEKLAAFFWIGWEGAVLRAKLEHSAEPLELFAALFFAGLERTV